MAIQFIAQNRTAEPVGMGTVHPQLVRPSGMRPERQERHKRTVPLCRNHPILGDGALAVLIVHHLTGAVDGIAEQRQVDDAVLLLRDALHEGKVFLLDGARLELPLQMVLGIGGLCHEEES